MKYKTKAGVDVELHEDDMKAISEMYGKKFDADKLESYFNEMHKKAHMNLEMISDDTIDTEKDMKHSLTKVLKYGTEEEVADFIIEAIECKVSKMILESMKWKE